MKKEVVIRSLVLFSFIILGLSLISAGWWGDLFGGITGNVVADDNFGYEGTAQAVGDFDGDGTDDLAVYDSGKWFIQQSTDGYVNYTFGYPGADPAVGDFDGDGTDDLAVYNKTEGIWHIQRSSAGYIDITFMPNGYPAVGDFDGDGTDDVAIYRPVLGEWYWNLTKVAPAAPFVASYTPACVYGEACGDIILVVESDVEEIEAMWEYEYSDGTKTLYCDNEKNPGLNCEDALENMVFIFDIFSLSYNINEIFENDSGKILESAEVKISAWGGDLRSGFVSLDIAIDYPCSHECDYVGQKICDGLLYRECGRNYDSGSLDSCFEYRAESSSCGVSTHCEAGACVQNTGPNTCDSSGGRCESLLPINSQVFAGKECGVTGYDCYICDEFYVYDEGRGYCAEENCFVNCENGGGICSPETLAHSEIDVEGECCSIGSCYVCDEGYHLYEGECVNNNCSGVSPSDLTGAIIGLSNFSSGVAKGWEFSYAADGVNSCLWKCNSSYHRRMDDNFCTFGMPSCGITVGRCVNGSLTFDYSYTLENYQCGEGEACIECSENYEWNGSACVTCQRTCVDEGEMCLGYKPIHSVELSQESCCDSLKNCYACSAGYEWNGWGCVDAENCDGCEYNGNCLDVGIRTNISENSLGRVYCAEGDSFERQKAVGEDCQNNYECETNSCSNGECVDLIERIEETGNNILQKIWCWITNWNDSAARAAC